MNETLVVLGSDWYWEQDALYRFTLIRSPVQPGRPYSPAALGRTRWELEGAHALTMTWEEHRALLSARRPFHDFQYLHRQVDGEVRYLTASGEPVFDAGGRFRGYRGTTRDISAQWAQRTQLQEAHSLLGVAAVVGRFGAWSADVQTGQVRWTEQARAVRAAAHAWHDAGRGDVHVRSGRPRAPARRLRALRGRRHAVRPGTAGADSLRTPPLGARDRGGRARPAGPHRAPAGRGAGHRREQGRGGRLPRPRGALPQHAMRESVFEEHYHAAMRGEVRRFDAFYAPLEAWFRVCAFPSGQGIAISFTDVTAATNARRLLQRQNEELERRVRERTEALRRINEELAGFSLAVAHDLRAPLAGIRGFTRAATERLQADGDAKVAHYLGRVDANASDMENLLAGLLSLSRVGSAELVWQPLNLSALARESAEALQAAHPARRVLVCVHDGLHARADLGLLRTLVNNLVGNAWKFSAGRDPAHIEIGQEPEGVYFVRDDGAGFDMARAQELFAPFRRLHDAREFSGVGIGLASARRVVERHGGRIWAESAPGEGAVFRFTLGPQAG